MAITVDSILKLPTSKKVLILIGILCVITGIFVYVFFIPWQSDMKLLKTQLDKLMKEATQGKMIARDLDKFKTQVKELRGELDKALTQLPNEKEIPDILKSISRLGKESNLEFTLFKPKPEEPQQFYARVPIDLVMVGSYHNIGQFFDRIGKLSRIINVIDFNMTRAKEVKGRESDVIIRTSSLITTYRFIEQKGEEKKSETKPVAKGATKEQGDENDVPKKR
ncbi:MAG: pilus assembly protein PilO [Deltaproteobacteria bacterium]|nr:pilus assembly protein PilO [Deltaproteobacteria bacterium]MBM4324759.1 pilus assembly protein PilO [Deltaproteobacteria bacterium]